ncbi:MAG: NAD-dependent epimerase/dehydratase family protein [Bacteroidota bacterium]
MTGAAGFIGYHLARRLLAGGHTVAGVDNYSGPTGADLKRERAAQLGEHAGFELIDLDVADRSACDALFAERCPEVVFHLAARAGIRHSVAHPAASASGNVSGTVSVLEACRQHGVRHLVYASSSSVYGLGGTPPFAEAEAADRPASAYAASKRAGELLAHSYSHLYGLPTTSLRFFTVYGPWGRPDMAYFAFAEAIRAGRALPLHNRGAMSRDFTFVGDVVEALVRVMQRPPGGPTPYRVYNVGRGEAVDLLTFVETLERALGRKAALDLQPKQDGDLLDTWADPAALEQDTGFRPATALEDGLAAFAAWFEAWTGAPAARNGKNGRNGESGHRREAQRPR